MNRYWNNLRPFEKRLLVVVGTVLFVVLNLWFVVPHFSDWDKVKMRMARAQRDLDLFERTIRQRPDWEKIIKQYEGEGLAVPPEDQLHHFNSAVQEQQVQSGVTITSGSKIQTRTNAFFLEQSQVVGVLSKEQNLVDFLYNLGSGNSLIRVRELTLRPDQPHQQLLANIKLVASYQKSQVKATPRTVTSTPPFNPGMSVVTTSGGAKPPAAAPKVNPTGPATQTAAPAGKTAAKTNSTAPPPRSILPATKQSTPTSKP